MSQYGIWLLAICLMGATVVSGCAARLQPPIVQAWTAVLVSDQTVVFEATVTELYPVMTLTQCPTGRGLRRASTGGYACWQRLFRFVSLDHASRTAFYRELVP
jgi:hypothetical protein